MNNHHVRFLLFVKVVAVVLVLSVMYFTPPFVTRFFSESLDFFVWLFAEMFTASFWEAALVVVSIWFKKAIVRSIVMTILTPLIILIFLVTLFDARDRRRIKAYIARKKYQARVRFRLVRRCFYRVFGYYGIFTLVITAVTIIWMVFTISWQLAAWFITWGPVRQIGASLYWIIQPLIDFIWPHLQSLLRGMYHRVWGIQYLVNFANGLYQRLVTGWVPLLYRWQKWIGNRFLRLLIKMSWIRGELHKNFRIKQKREREERRKRQQLRREQKLRWREAHKKEMRKRQKRLRRRWRQKVAVRMKGTAMGRLPYHPVAWNSGLAPLPFYTQMPLMTEKAYEQALIGYKAVQLNHKYGSSNPHARVYFPRP